MYRQHLDALNIENKNSDAPQSTSEKETIDSDNDKLQTQIKSNQDINEQLLKDIEYQREKINHHKEMLEEEFNQLMEIYDKRKEELEKDKLALEEDSSIYRNILDSEINELALIIKAHCVNERKLLTDANEINIFSKDSSKLVRDDSYSHSPIIKDQGNLHYIIIINYY